MIDEPTGEVPSGQALNYPDIKTVSLVRDSFIKDVTTGPVQKVRLGGEFIRSLSLNIDQYHAKAKDLLSTEITSLLDFGALKENGDFREITVPVSSAFSPSVFGYEMPHFLTAACELDFLESPEGIMENPKVIRINGRRQFSRRTIMSRDDTLSNNNIVYDADSANLYAEFMYNFKPDERLRPIVERLEEIRGVLSQQADSQDMNSESLLAIAEEWAFLKMAFVGAKLGIIPFNQAALA